LAFWSGTNCRSLVHELSCDQPKTTKELLDIASKHAYSEEAVGAVSMQSSEKATPSGRQGTPAKASDKGAKIGARSDKRGPMWRPQQVTVATSGDGGDNDKDVDDSDEELIAAAEHDLKC
jgi:hypothetical protein